MRPARKSWTPAINAAGLGMLPIGSVGSITIVVTAVVATASASETYPATPSPGPALISEPRRGHMRRIPRSLTTPPSREQDHRDSDHLRPAARDPPDGRYSTTACSRTRAGAHRSWVTPPRARAH